MRRRRWTKANIQATRVFHNTLQVALVANEEAAALTMIQRYGSVREVGVFSLPRESLLELTSWIQTELCKG